MTEENSAVNTVNRVSGLDLLRAVAITSVVLFHYRPATIILAPFKYFGWMGVDLFFVLSGYLIGGQLLGLYQKERSISLKKFYCRASVP